MQHIALAAMANFFLGRSAYPARVHQIDASRAEALNYAACEAHGDSVKCGAMGGGGRELI